MTILLTVNTAPYGSEGPYNALRLAEALAAAGSTVEVFLMGDGVHMARSGQQPGEAHASLERMLRSALEQEVRVACCATCCRARGLAANDLIEGVQVATIHDLAEAVERCERTLSF